MRSRLARAPWWAWVLAIFLASRVLSTVILLAFAARQEINAWTSAQPSYWQFANLWDGRWYYIVAYAGYPVTLPVTDAGQVAENAWAFMPAYPTLVEGMSLLTGVPFVILAPVISTLCAAAAALVIYRLFALVLAPSTALFAVTLFCVAPVSPILQVAYAESLHTLLLAGALYFLLQRRYGLVALLAVVMSFTRPSGLAFALALTLHWAYRWWRERDDFSPRERIAAAAAAVASGLAGLAWPAFAWAATGRLTAYTDTELAWRAPYIGYQHLVPFTPWFQSANWWFPGWGIPALLVVLALTAAAMFLPAVRQLGADLRFWVASWLLYLLAVFFPQSSTFRLLLPAFPLLGALAVPTSKTYRVLLVLFSIAGQVVWVWAAWWVDGYDWTPP